MSSKNCDEAELSFSLQEKMQCIILRQGIKGAGEKEKRKIYRLGQKKVYDVI